jgi:hypothetical protein
MKRSGLRKPLLPVRGIPTGTGRAGQRSIIALELFQ